MSAARPVPRMPVTPRPAPAGGRPAFSTTTPAPARDAAQRASLGVSGPIPIRSVPRAAIEALVAWLVAAGAVAAPSPAYTVPAPGGVLDE